MSGTQREWWAKLRDYFDGNERFFSEPGRTEREKAPVREFLKYLGVEFREEELAVPPKDGEVEVRFRDARLQNVERMEPAGRRHEEVRQFAEHVRSAAPEAPRCDSVPMRTAELLREVVKALDKKSRKTARRLARLNAHAGTALDRNTGRLAWLNGTNPTGYASPILYHSAGKDSVLIFAAKHLVALEPQTGQELWRFPWETGWDTNNPDPLIYRDQIFISSFSRGCALLAIRDGKPQLVYDKKTLHNHLSPGILLGEYLYAFNGEAKQQTDFRCIHLPSGDVQWSRKDPAFGSLICANGKLLVLSEKGELLLGEPSPTQFNPLARAQILAGLCWTPPVLANGLLYARNSRGDLICLNLKPSP